MDYKSMIVVLLLSVVFAQAQSFGFGACPKVTVQSNFQPARYFDGVFYLQKQFASPFFDEGIKCNMDNFTMTENGEFKLTRSAVPYFSDMWTRRAGTVTCNEHLLGSCTIDFGDMVAEEHYVVLSSDPEKYGLIYACEPYALFMHYQHAWIYTRERTIPSEEMQTYLDIFTSNGVDISYFNDVLQNCSN